MAHRPAPPRPAEPAGRGPLRHGRVRRHPVPAGAGHLPGAGAGAGRGGERDRAAAVRRLPALGELGRRRPRRQPQRHRRDHPGGHGHPGRPRPARPGGGDQAGRPRPDRGRRHHPAAAGAARLPGPRHRRLPGPGRGHRHPLAGRALPPEAAAGRRAAGRHPGRPGRAPGPPPPGYRYRDAGEFLADVRLVQASLAAAGAARLAYGELQHLAWQAETFGFHLASLEVRQHAAVHAEAVAELAPAPPATPPRWTGWPPTAGGPSPRARARRPGRCWTPCG